MKKKRGAKEEKVESGGGEGEIVKKRVVSRTPKGKGEASGNYQVRNDFGDRVYEAHALGLLLKAVLH